MKNEKNIFQPPWKHQFPLATKSIFLILYALRAIGF